MGWICYSDVKWSGVGAVDWPSKRLLPRVQQTQIVKFLQLLIDLWLIVK